MKKADREIYIVLSAEVDYSPCCFCKFVISAGCAEEECTHPLKDKAGFPDCDYALEPGQDCWAFRPAHDVATTADIVGIVLSNGFESAGWSKNKEGRLEVYGAKARQEVAR